MLLAGPMVPSDPSRPSRAPLRPRTAVQRDVDAIMQGMDRNHIGLHTQTEPDDGG